MVADLRVEAVFDLRTDPHDDVLADVEKWLSVQFDRSSAVYGRQGVTAGFRTDQDTWVRIQWRRAWMINGPAWTGAECASVLRGVAKPDLLRSVRWRDDTRGMVWRADEMELILSPAVSGSGVVGTEPALSESWWKSLQNSFAALAAYKTERVGMSSAHLTRRVTEVFGDSVDTTIDEWMTAHADIHWGNLTAPDCYLLDWEDWGIAPRGFDAAMLWGHSLRVPKLADRIQREFQADLTTRSGQLAQLVFCANVIRVSARRSEPNPLLEPSKKAAYVLISELQTR
ncbi:aminoglycoside phosphotransferase [Candidatus Protofrankia californiensis]|uniref:Aminoglycoside phosphotransferase n=1 Tax=Candidatus Protofrankia californiensis TaxID=1839754 RepID=A0A1C3P4I7_9ACTN|nr:aminoglycoside phosphotransferase [Candidatus Protofrankia californiensis]